MINNKIKNLKITKRNTPPIRVLSYLRTIFLRKVNWFYLLLLTNLFNYSYNKKAAINLFSLLFNFNINNKEVRVY